MNDKPWFNNFTNQFTDAVDKHSITGKEIKECLRDIISRSRYNNNIVNLRILKIGEKSEEYILTIDTINDFYAKYCEGSKAIKDNIYYNINCKRNKYQFLTLSRDLKKSPRNINNVKTYEPTYDTISKDPEMISSYYSSKYGISNTDNIVTMFTEDDIMCLDCGCISDERLTDVPDKKVHIKRFICPKCKSETSALATYNRYTHQLNTIYRNK